MSSSSSPNAMVMQSGGCTPVLNRSLYGLAAAIEESQGFGTLYGAVHGLEGLLNGDLRDLQSVSRSAWSRIARTPGAALGSTRHKLQPEEVPALLQVLSDYRIGFFFIIGGNDSAATAQALSQAAAEAGQPITAINVPKTIDNDLVRTDHSPGYGSAARFVALATIGAGQDALAMGQAAPITIIEVMGRDAGWLAASAALARQKPGDAPHLVCLPEVPVEEEKFVGIIETAYRNHGFAVAVVAENARGPDGVLGGQQEPWLVDDFGHAYYDGPARYLAAITSRKLGVRVRHEKPGTIQRSFMTALSRTDVQEAEMAGRAAVALALEGQRDQMVTLVRNPGPKYECSAGAAPLSQVATQVKVMPPEYLDPQNYWVTEAFLDYLRPLVGTALPRYQSLI